MKKFSFATVVLILLSAGIGALSAWLVCDGDDSKPVVQVSAEPAAKTPPPSMPTALERALRRRIRQLEGELAAARSPAAETNATVRAEIRPMPQQADFRPRSPREMMEEMRKNDPKRYADMQRRHMQMRKRQLQRTKGRLDFLGGIETAGMSNAERSNHERLQDLLVQRENLPEPSEDMTDEERQAGFQKRRALEQAIRSANETERKTLLKQTARALGLGDEDAETFVGAIQEVVDATSSEHGHHGPPPSSEPSAPPVR